MKLTASLLLLFLCRFAVQGQDLTNKGTDFWLGYGYHVNYSINNSQEMVLYFATDAVTNITVTIPGVGYTRTYSNIPAGTVLESDPMPKTGATDARLPAEGLYNTGIHVTSDKPVVAYAHIYNASVSGASLLFPTATLGKDYYSINYTQKSNVNASNGFFFVVAADTGTTTVEITPSAQTLTHAAGVPFQVKLSQGQIYNVMGTVSGLSGVDLTGSRIRSISTNGATCKRIAVFSGSGKIYINCGSQQANSADNLFAQAFPATAWGQRFLTAPTANMPYNYFRVAVSDPATVVKVNGSVVSGLVNNFYYDLPLTNQPLLIEADKAITVAQYITTAGNGSQPTCGNRVPGIPGDGDPEMIYLSPIEQTTNTILLNSTTHYAINQHYINLIINTNAVSTVLLDGSPAASYFNTHPAYPSYSYAQIPVIAGQHSVQADSGFNVIAYGYGPAESYGYNGGTNIKDLYQFISIVNPNSIIDQPYACSHSPFYLSITLPYQPLSLYWNFHDPAIMNQSINNPVYDTSYVSHGKTVYRYKLSNQYLYKVGTYPITVTVNNPTPDGCSGEQQIDFNLKVFDPPVSDFYYRSNGCVNGAVSFRDTSNLNGTNAYKWFWDFGDGTTSTAKNPVHTYTTADTFKVRYAVITDVGCLSDTITKLVYVTNLPVAAFGISKAVCIGSTLTFSDSSALTGPGKLVKWIWNYDDGNADTLLSNASRTHIYNSLSSYHPKLNVVTSSGCISKTDSVDLTIHPFPEVQFSLPVVCLPGGTGSFNDSSKINDGTASGFKYLWNFGDPSSNKNIDSIQNPSHVFSTTGPYNIKLQVTSINGCTADTTETLSTIYPAVHSVFNVKGENCLNDSTRFTDQTNAGNYPLVKWLWNMGDGKQDSVQNPAHLYAGAGNYNVSLYGITNKGCYTDTVTKNVIIDPLPTAAFSHSMPDCVLKDVSFTDASVAHTGNVVQWQWSFGDSSSSSIQNPVHQYATSGTFNAVLQVTTDKGCVSMKDTMQVLINPTPVPGFISPEVCLSDAYAQFVDSSKVEGGDIVSWSWNFGDATSGSANTSSLQNPKHQYHAIGNYPVKLTVTTNNGCVSTIDQMITVNGDKPLADFNINNAGGLCANDSVSITDGSSVNFGAITRTIIFWDNAGTPLASDTDYNPVKGKTYYHLYPNFQNPSTKTFTIRYRVFSGNTCVNEITKSILVHAAPKVVFGAIPDVCYDAAPYAITQAKETGGVSGGGVFSGQGVTNTGIFNPKLAGVGPHVIHFTYTSSYGCVDTASSVVNVLPPPVAGFAVSTLNCEKQDIIFSDSSSSAVGTIVKWKWDFNDGNTLVNNNSASFAHQFNTAKIYNVSLVVTNNKGCNSSFSKPVVVHAVPVPDFSVSKTCMPVAKALFTNLTTISDSTGSQITYAWDFGDANSGASNSSTIKDPVHIYPSVNTYSVQLIATSANGCIKDTVKKYADIHPQPASQFMPSIIEACVGSVISFTDKSTNTDAKIDRWDWDFGDGSSSTTQNPFHQFNTAGTFNVKLLVTDSNTCVSDPFILPVTIDAYPVVNAKPDRFVLEGDTIVLSPEYSGTSLTYLWSPPDYLSSNTVANPVVTGVEDRMYTIKVTGKGDCSASDQVFVKVLRTPKVPNTFTPNHDGINDFWIIENLQFYRNAKVQVFDRYGQSVFESNGYATPWDGNYKGRPVPPGTYYYVILPGNGRKPVTGYVTVLK